LDPGGSTGSSRLTARNSAQKRVSGWLGRLIRDVTLPLLIPVGSRMGRRLFLIWRRFDAARARVIAVFGRSGES
jgi:hypothetical protein